MKNQINIIEILLAKAKKLGADEVDVLNVTSKELSATIRNGSTESIERAETNGFGLRVMLGKKQAIVSSSSKEEEDIDCLVSKAMAMVKIAPDDPYIGLAKEQQMAKNILDLSLSDESEPDPSWLIDTAASCEAAALESDQITNSSGANSSYSHNIITIANSNGFLNSYHSSYNSFSVSVVAGKDDQMQVDYDFSGARFRDELASPVIVGKKAASLAISKLNAKKIASCKIPVIFDPRVAKTLLSSFAAAINGASITKGMSFLKNDLGNQIFPANVNIIDDPTIIRGLASRPFDAEAIGGNKRLIVENGVLKSWLLDLRSARQLNMETTASAYRSIASSPHAGTSNFYLNNGSLSKDALLKTVKKALYVTNLMGMGVNAITGDYSQGASGFYIENGEIIHPVNEVTIASNLKHMFANMVMADDLTMLYSINSPTILIEEMILAGV